MEDKEESMSEVITEIPVEIKVPSAKIHVTSVDRTVSVSPIRKITIRQSTDSPARQQTNYEIITQIQRDSKHQDPAEPLSPTVKLQRYDPPESPQSKALKNGLDPIGIELISSASLASSKVGSEYSEKCDEIHAPAKVSREMKNLQKSKNESKILSDYLNTLNDIPRSRSRKSKEASLADPDQEEEAIVSSHTELKDLNDIESATVLSMEPPEKRRKSISRSRNRSRSTVRSRKKSIAQMMSDELLVSSDKEEVPEDEEEDQLSEVSFVTNRSIDGRAVNPPPKVSLLSTFLTKLLVLMTIFL